MWALLDPTLRNGMGTVPHSLTADPPPMRPGWRIVTCLSEAMARPFHRNLFVDAPGGIEQGDAAGKP